MFEAFNKALIVSLLEVLLKVPLESRLVTGSVTSQKQVFGSFEMFKLKGFSFFGYKICSKNRKVFGDILIHCGG